MERHQKWHELPAAAERGKPEVTRALAALALVLALTSGAEVASLTRLPPAP